MRLIDADALFDAAFEIWGDEADGGETNLFMEMINNAPTITPPPNEPLTLEELWEMDGEPVFIKRIGSDHPDDRAWALVDAKNEVCRMIYGCKAFFLFYKKSWLAYHRRPEEGTV